MLSGHTAPMCCFPQHILNGIILILPNVEPDKKAKKKKWKKSEKPEFKYPHINWLRTLVRFQVLSFDEPRKILIRVNYLYRL